MHIAPKLGPASLLLLSFTACTVEARTGDGPPIIDKVDAPDAIDLGPDGSYHLDPRVTFHDPDNDEIVEARVTFEGAGTAETRSIGFPEGKRGASGTQTLNVVFGSAFKGTITYRIVVVDATSKTSAESTKTVILR